MCVIRTFFQNLIRISGGTVLYLFLSESGLRLGAGHHIPQKKKIGLFEISGFTSQAAKFMKFIGHVEKLTKVAKTSLSYHRSSLTLFSASRNHGGLIESDCRE